MHSRKALLAVVMCAAFSIAVPGRGAAQPAFEVGGSLANFLVSLDEGEDSRSFGIPSASLGLFNPGVYGSFFIGKHAAVEPQIGLIWMSSGNYSSHIVTMAAQVDYFITGVETRSPFVFAGAGITDTSGSSRTPKSVAVGAGYRIPVGDRLVFRFDGRYMHLDEGGGNSLAFGLSIGGVFLRR